LEVLLSRRATALGLLALALWSTSNAISLTLVERLGPFTFLALGFGGGGLVLASVEAFRHRRWDAALRPGLLPGLLCGAAFLGYAACYGLAWRFAPDPRTALVLGLVNYLWPCLTLLLSLAFFPARIRALPLLSGLALGLLGIAAAGVRSAGDLAASLALAAGCPLAFGLMLAGAVCWAFYTNLARRYGGSGGVALYEIATGAVCLPLAWGETSRWSWDLAFPAAFQVLAIGAAAYALWEHGVRKGDLVTLGSAAYGLPVVATAFSCAWFGEAPTVGLLLGSALVAAGALLCRAGITPASTPPGSSAGSGRSSGRT
jgi:drug/metabolite transporter (DMT)-like permease